MTVCFLTPYPNQNLLSRSGIVSAIFTVAYSMQNLMFIDLLYKR